MPFNNCVGFAIYSWGEHSSKFQLSNSNSVGMGDFLSIGSDKIFVKIALCQKLNKIFWSNLEALPVFKALCWDDPRVEHLPRIDDPQVKSGTTPGS